MRPEQIRKLCKHLVENKKNTVRNQVFVKLFQLPFHLFAFQVTFIITSNPAFCRQNEFIYSLKTAHK